MKMTAIELICLNKWHFVHQFYENSLVEEVMVSVLTVLEKLRKENIEDSMLYMLLSTSATQSVEDKEKYLIFVRRIAHTQIRVL